MSNTIRFSPIALGITALASVTVLVACDSSRPADSTRNGRIVKAKCNSELAFNLGEVYQKRQEMAVLSKNAAGIKAQPVDAKIRTVFVKDELNHSSKQGVVAFAESSVQSPADIFVSNYDCQTLSAILHYPGFEQGREVKIKNVDVNKIEFTAADHDQTIIKVEIPYPEKIKKLEKMKFAQKAINDGENKIVITETKLENGLKQETVIISDAKAAASDADIFSMQLGTLRNSAGKLNVNFDLTSLGQFVRQNMGVAGKAAAKPMNPDSLEVSASVRQLKEIFGKAERIHADTHLEGEASAPIALDTASAAQPEESSSDESSDESKQGESKVDSGTDPVQAEASDANGVTADPVPSISVPKETADDNDGDNVIAREDKVVANEIKQVQAEQRKAIEHASAQGAPSERIKSIEAGLAEHDGQQFQKEFFATEESDAALAAQMEINSDVLKKLANASSALGATASDASGVVGITASQASGVVGVTGSQASGVVAAYYPAKK